MQKAKKFKIPGDIIIIPMFIGCAINSLLPQILEIGGFTTPIVKGAGPLVLLHWGDHFLKKYA